MICRRRARLIGAWKEMRETWRRQKIDPDYQYDTPLPPTAMHAREDAPDKGLEASIGELAPAGTARAGLINCRCSR